MSEAVRPYYSSAVNSHPLSYYRVPVNVNPAEDDRVVPYHCVIAYESKGINLYVVSYPHVLPDNDEGPDIDVHPELSSLPDDGPLGNSRRVFLREEKAQKPGKGELHILHLYVVHPLNFQGTHDGPRLFLCPLHLFLGLAEDYCIFLGIFGG